MAPTPKQISNLSLSPQVAVDDGFAQLKAFAAASQGRQRVELVLPTAVRPGRDALTALGGESNDGFYESAGRPYTASEIIASTSTIFDGFHTSDLNRVAVAHALVRAGFAGQTVSLVCGLPVGDFFLNGKRNDALIKTKRENLMIPVTLADGSPAITYDKVTVVAQGIAAVVDYFFDDNLRVNKGPDGTPVEVGAPVAVVDIGGGTTDVAVVLGGDKVDQARTGTHQAGVIRVREWLGDEIKQRHRIRTELPQAALDKALKTRSIKVLGQVHDVGDIIDAAVREVGDEIARFVDSLLKGAGDVDSVLFVGGGAELFKGLLAEYPHGFKPDRAEFANVRGMYKYVAARAAAKASSAPAVAA